MIAPAGRRASLNDASSSLPAPLFAYQHRADGLLTQVTSNNQNYAFTYADNGLLTGRVDPFRSLSVDGRDGAGRILGQTQVANGASVLVEDVFWRANSTLDSYSATRSGTGAWNDTRVYSYNARGQLLIEGFSPAAGATNTLNYSFDGNNPGLGVRLGAKIGTGAPASWETSATANNLGRVTADSQLSVSGRAVPASGVASGADHVDISVDGISQGRAAYTGSGPWSISLDLAAGSHSLGANAVDPSGLFTATANSTFTVTAANPSEQAGTVTNGYDDDGNVTSRSWSSGLTQTLTWDAFGRLIKVSQRNSANNGYDWTAIYDGLGRRLLTSQQPVANNVVGSATNVTTSIYDPQVEFLEIGVAVSGAKAWKVYGPDLNGRFGGLQGTGGLEAVILDADGTTTGVINDQFGNGVATVSGGSVTWYTTRVGAYGPLPGIQAQTLTDVTQVAASTAWRSRRIDPTGFYWLGARYYEPTSGRFLSADPMGQAASPSLYDFAHGDPVNYFDPTGRIFGTGLSTGEFFGAIGIGALHGAEAFSDGVTGIAGAHPFANNGFYDPNDSSLQVSQRIGTATVVIAGSVLAVGATSTIVSEGLAANEITALQAIGINGLAGTGISVLGNTATQLAENGGNWGAVDPMQQIRAGSIGLGFGMVGGVAIVTEQFIEQSLIGNLANLQLKAEDTEYEMVLQLANRERIDAVLADIEQSASFSENLANTQMDFLSFLDRAGLPIAEGLFGKTLEEQLFGHSNENGLTGAEGSLNNGNTVIQQDPTGKYTKPSN